ncbi:hypothetical protein FGE12_19650 [Aggregicoccus sp. 17bor-14]|uniref:hypothetical protein n=1 Tax=Myxococcaceae TaxID=31 RepID=UPI00129CFA38|nr:MULTISPECIES: hypothetical protein [Myxococcaceae]MBF5044625.1 hypothetical protein [Simulacricoccus sp. 17bor-14]MRI90369.1 hypothetical protein [Aggregicoccus sp. 17bor-14]
MGAVGAVIMSFFGAVFAALTLHSQRGWSGPSLAAPFAVFAALALAARTASRLPGPGLTHSARAGRAILWSSTAEGVGIFVAANVVDNLGHPELLLPAMALVVGLHFLPIAFAMTFRPFYVLGAALLAASAAGFLLAPPLGPQVSGFAAALSLWGAAALAVLRERRARSRPPVAA